MERKTLEEMIQETYPDDTLRQAAFDEVAKARTEDDIVSGKLVLPHPIELTRHLQRLEAERTKQQR